MSKIGALFYVQPHQIHAKADRWVSNGLREVNPPHWAICAAVSGELSAWVGLAMCYGHHMGPKVVLPLDTEVANWKPKHPDFPLAYPHPASGIYVGTNHILVRRGFRSPDAGRWVNIHRLPDVIVRAQEALSYVQQEASHAAQA